MTPKTKRPFNFTKLNIILATLLLIAAPAAYTTVAHASGGLRPGFVLPLAVAQGGTNATSASIAAFNNITGYTASGATGTTSSNLVFSASPTFTGVVQLAAGSQAAPSVNWGDAGTGIFWRASNQIAITNNNSTTCYFQTGIVNCGGSDATFGSFTATGNLTVNGSYMSTLLKFGGATSSHVALKRSGTTLQVRLGDDSGDGGLSAATVTATTSSQVSGSTVVASLGTCNAGARGTRKVVTDASAPAFLTTLTGGGAVVSPAFCDGTNWVAG